MARNYRELQTRMSPAARARATVKAQDLIATMGLDELREARQLTQTHLAGLLGVNQAAVSKLERRADMYVSSLRHTIEAMGGQLEICAKFPDGQSVHLRQFGERAPLAGRRRAKGAG